MEEEIPRKYLNVPYLQRDKAKELGAFWDSDVKRWYAPRKSNGKYYHSVNYNKLDKLFEKEQIKIPYKVSYNDRATAKELGMCWSPEMKCWYHYEHDNIDCPFSQL